MIPLPFPEQSRERDAWILTRRPQRATLDPLRPSAFLVEEERADSGELVSVATVFLTNSECPWRCLMCDLWKFTLAEPTPAGAIPTQIEYALERLSSARQIKLYNSGSFFDARAVPPGDYPAIAERIGRFERVIVECHPALVDDRVVRFQELLLRHGGRRGQLEVAMGLETVHPDILPRLNKRMTLEQFARAADFLELNGIALRVFILVQPPFCPDAEAVLWARRSVEFAVQCGATVAVLIPTRFGNGALEVLAHQGHFHPPPLSALESALEAGLKVGTGRVFADLWDLEQFSKCPACLPHRRDRLREMNYTQQILPKMVCEACGA